MQEYTVEKAKHELLMLELEAPSSSIFIIGFTIIAERLTAGMTDEEIHGQEDTINFIFWAMMMVRDAFMSLDSKLYGEKIITFHRKIRYRLKQCNGANSSYIPEDVDGRALWNYYQNEFMPVVELVQEVNKSLA